ncbi:unnamed protein product [Cyprideis torosa]|uniref:Tetraspanin n=1 Tax=Cyprideis torosa TaxID=163714 RepID=A0A7R8W2U1_9CRUS|nr:unnamed protein product [Cyprideis torosa]CAG0881425.1 unnamed protein product [Cyprideis torosa]
MVTWPKNPCSTHACGVAAKWPLVILNVLLLIAGVVIIIVGIVSMIRNDQALLDNFNNKGPAGIVKHGSIALIISGGVLIVISILGVVAAVTESRIALIVFAFIVGILFLFVVIGAVMALAFQQQTIDMIGAALYQDLLDFNPNEADRISTRAWNWLQNTTLCCGVRNLTDWRNNTYYKSEEQGANKVPATCCKSQNAKGEFDNEIQIQCQRQPNSTNAYLEGCLTANQGKIRDLGNIVGYVGIVAAVIMVRHWDWLPDRQDNL